MDLSNGLVPLDTFLGNHNYQLFQGFDSNYDTWIYTWSRIEVGGKMEYQCSVQQKFLFFYVQVLIFPVLFQLLFYCQYVTGMYTV